LVYSLFAARFYWRYSTHSKRISAPRLPDIQSYRLSHNLLNLGVTMTPGAPINEKKPEGAADGDVDAGRMAPAIKAMSYALAFSTLCLFIRAVYRCIEVRSFAD
jgi:hypothetical protein